MPEPFAPAPGLGGTDPRGEAGEAGEAGVAPAPPPATARRRSVCASRAAAISLRSATCSSASAARILMIHIERSSNSRSVLRSSATSTSSRFDEDFPHPPKHPGAAAPRSASSRRPSSVDSGSGSFDDAVDGRLSARYSLRTSMGFVPAETARCASRMTRTKVRSTTRKTSWRHTTTTAEWTSCSIQGPDGEGDVFGAGKGMVREDRAGRGGSAGDDGAGGGGGGVIFSVG